jgi:beta-xylosidase
VCDDSCPDPAVVQLESSGTLSFFLVCTQEGFPIYRSPDMVDWSRTGEMIFKPDQQAVWTRSGSLTAPEIHAIGGGFVTYYSAIDRTVPDGHESIGVARASDPLGPWTDLGRPLLRDATRRFTSPTEFTDSDGKMYLYWHSDNGSLYVQQLAVDGLSLLGTPTRLFSATQTWEAAVIDSPFVVHHGGYYYLFYGGNQLDSARHSISVARSTSPRGPFTKHTGPLLQSNTTFVGPAGASVVHLRDADFAVYGAFRTGSTLSGRVVLLDRITWSSDWPRIGGGTPGIANLAWPQS